MRIALVSDYFLPRHGGIELQIRDLGRQLISKGHTAVVHSTTVGPLLVDGVPVRRIESLMTPAGFSISLNLASKIAREIRCFEVVHIHMSIVSPLGYAALRAARDLRLPTVVTYHSVLGFTAHALRLGALVCALDKRSNLIISAVSHRVAREVERALPGLAVRVLPNGVDTTFWHSCLAPEARADCSVVSAMRLNKRKRPFALLRAFRSAQRQASRPLGLDIAGEGPQRTALQAYIKKHEMKNVFLHGVLNRDQLRRLYQQSHVFVSPATKEAFGIAALEARCAGLPVIAMTDAGSVDFLKIGKPQPLASDDFQLASEIARLADEGVRRQFAGFDPSLQAYDWPQVTEKHLAIYSEVAGKARG